MAEVSEASIEALFSRLKQMYSNSVFPSYIKEKKSMDLELQMAHVTVIVTIEAFKGNHLKSKCAECTTNLWFSQKNLKTYMGDFL